MENLEMDIFSIRQESQFEALCLRVFQFQATQNPVYREYISLLGIQPSKVTKVKDIPFLPIEFFKSNRVISLPAGFKQEKPSLKFTSSSTTGTGVSLHEILKRELYEKSFTLAAGHFLKPKKGTVWLALLPSYLERKESSLVFMVKALSDQSGSLLSGFYLNDFDALSQAIHESLGSGAPVILFGVTFALLDFAEQFSFCQPTLQVVETGGMKGRKTEPVRAEVHALLREKLGTDNIFSEYGMTELCSQAYAKAHGVFQTMPWMKVLVRDANDPFHYLNPGKTGALNIIDLANLYSCSFIETSDLGRESPGGGFEVLGRLENSDLRGCNMLYKA